MLTVNGSRSLSVAMCTYNGSRYVARQIETILPQLDREDEIVIVDDGSSDSTCEIINGFHDRRICLLQSNINLGVVASFERAILEARGDIIFLSDQDDLWAPGKVSRFREVFKDPKVTLALSDANIIDADGIMTGRTFFQARGGFVPGVMENILRNHYIGCTMAFRRDILAYCLPFPKNVPMHDWWIGIVNDLFGKTEYIDESLVMYRRHGQNISRRGSPIQQVQWRFNLLLNIIQLRRRAARDAISISF